MLLINTTWKIEGQTEKLCWNFKEEEFLKKKSDVKKILETKDKKIRLIRPTN